MKHVIAGTAGHIDHGKTALVRALTGVDTDRFEEEKRRGISIDIGFAHFDSGADTRIAFIDVPGHEKFIKNMLAGIGGIDFVMLAIAADESIKPQTREHFDICRLLQIRSGCVVLTKSDLVDGDTIEVAKLEVADFVKGSFLENSPVIPVSAMTGDGLEALRQTLADLAWRAPQRDSSQHLRLPIDRSFVMQGFGTVVTGTVFAGSVRLEDEVQAYPSSRRLRVRGIQVHGRPAKEAAAGQRAALNVTGAEHEDLYRGMTLGPPGILATSNLIDVSFELLPGVKPLKARTPIQFHHATAQVPGELRVISNGLARIALRDPLLVLPGDRFIARLSSPAITIGGGEVLDSDPPRRMSHSRAARLIAHPLPLRLAERVAEHRSGIAAERLVAVTGLRLETIQAALPNGVRQFGDRLFDKSAIEKLQSGWRADLLQHHKQAPLSPGLSKEELRSRYLPDAPGSIFDALLADDRQVVVNESTIRLASHRLSLQEDEKLACDRIVDAFAQAGFRAPATADVLVASGVDQSRAKTLLHLLLRQGRLIRVSEDFLLHPSAQKDLKEILAPRKGQRFTVGDFKDWTGVSRKYAIPLLEHLDRERITRRDGDSRVVL